MSARAELILALRGNLVSGLRQVQQQFRTTSTVGQQSIRALSRGVDLLGNRYAALAGGAAVIGGGRFAISQERRLTRLGITANASAEQVAQLNREIYETAQSPDIRIDPAEILTALESILEKTGDLKFAEANIRNVALAIQATGAGGQAVGELLGEFQKLGTVDPRGVMLLLDTLNVQGKAGAFTLQNLAALGPRVVSAYSGAVKGNRDNAAVMREMGAALQAIRMGTGSSEQAATSFERLLAELQDAQKQPLFRKLGIQIFQIGKDGQRALRPINELMTEFYEKTKGDRVLLGGLFGDESIRAFGGAGIGRLQEFMDVQADGTQTTNDSARAARDAAAAIESLSTSWKQFADNNLTPIIQDASDALNSIGPGTVQRWAKVGAQILVVVGAAMALRKIFQLARFGAGVFGGGRAGGAAGGVGGGIGGALGGLPLPLPVFVVNRQMSLLPGGYGGGPGAPAGAGAATRAGRLATLARGAAGVGLAGAAGYAAGTAIYKTALEGNAVGDSIGGGIARLMALFGSQDAQDAIDTRRASRPAEAKLNGSLTIQLDQRGARVTDMSVDQPGVDLNVRSGRLGAPS